jgi:hypothetical protein
MSLRLGRLLLSRLSAAGLAAIAPATRSHVLAAVHYAVAVPVGAAAPAHGVALMLVVPALRLTLRRLVPSVASMSGMAGTALRLVLRVVLVLCRGRRLSGGRHGERKRNRTDNNLHLKVS